ncbi:MAG: ribosomal protein S18 acetylase RimI-like enzyme [Oceanicoccus sp.]|jgi:ribosomal protein S18 acetylase RimI-like enzyme
MYEFRKYIDDDSRKINALALLSFTHFKPHYNDWDSFSRALNKFSELSNVAEIIVATNSDDTIIGAVAYVPANVTKADYFPKDTPIIRMLVVHPDYRGKGIGKSLSEACVNRAIRDSCKSIALHTSAIMTVALPMYLNMGFVKHSEAPDIFGVKYSVYVKDIA